MSFPSDALFGSGVPTCNWTLSTGQLGNTLGNDGNLAQESTSQGMESSSQQPSAIGSDVNNLALRIYKSDDDERETEGTSTSAVDRRRETTDVKLMLDPNSDRCLCIGGEMSDTIDIQSGQNTPCVMQDIGGKASNVQRDKIPFIHNQTMGEIYLCNDTAGIPSVLHGDGSRMQYQPIVPAVVCDSRLELDNNGDPINQLYPGAGTIPPVEVTPEVTGYRPPAARAKTTQGVRNKNKKLKPKHNLKPSDHSPGRHESQTRPGRNGLILSHGFKPELRVRKYDNNDEISSSHKHDKGMRQNALEPVDELQTLVKAHGGTTAIKTRPKRDENGNSGADKLHTGVLVSADRSREMRLPLGLDPYINPSKQKTIYSKRNYRREKEPHPMLDGDHSEEFHSVSHIASRIAVDTPEDSVGRERGELLDETSENREVLCDSDDTSQTSVKILKPGNHLEYRNNLWQARGSDTAVGHIAQKNVNIERQQHQAGPVIRPVYDGGNQPLPVRIHNNLKTLQSGVNVQAVGREESSIYTTANTGDQDSPALPLPRVLQPTQQSNTGDQDSPALPMPHVLQPTQQSNTFVNDISPQACIQDTAPIDVAPRLEQTQDGALFVGTNDSYSDVPSAALFGEGDSDYMLARELQARYDRESDEIRHHGELDIAPDDVYLNNTDRDTHDLNLFRNDDLSTDSLEADTCTDNCNISNAVLPIPSVNNRELDTYSNTDLNQLVQDQIRNDEQYPVNVEDHCLPREPELRPKVENFREGSQQFQPELDDRESCRRHCGVPTVVSAESQALDDEAFARLVQDQLNLDVEKEDEELARQLQENDERHSVTDPYETPRRGARGRDSSHEPLHTRYIREPAWHGHTHRTSPVASNVADSRVLEVATTDRHRRPPRDTYYIDPVNEYNEDYDIPPHYARPDYRHNYGYVLDDYGPEDEHLVSMTRDPHLLASLLMQRAPDMMIPNNVDLNDYEALWELAERLGEVRRVGMDPAELARLPVHTYQPAPGPAATDNTDCRVCLSEFEAEDQLRTLPCCHTYHVDCIDQWLTRNAICPVCRQSVQQANNSV